MRIDAMTLLLQPTITVVFIAIITFLARAWLSTRLKESVAAEYRAAHERDAAEVRWSITRREKATQVADVLTSWVALEVDPTKRESPAAYLELQRKYWELALWLDAPTLRMLNQALAHHRGANYKQALAGVRRTICGAEENPVLATEFIHWTMPSPPVEKLTSGSEPLNGQ